MRHITKHDMVKETWVATTSTERAPTGRNLSTRGWNVCQVVGVNQIHVQRLRVTQSNQIKGVVGGIGRGAWGDFSVLKFTLGSERDQQT